MDYLILTENFLKEYPDYRHDIINFNEYLGKQWKNSLSDETIRFLLQGLNVEFLLNSLIYNVEEKEKYKSKTTAKRYATVIGQFFNYIRKNTDIENPQLYDAISYNRLRENTYMRRMMAYIDSCNKLSGVVELEALGHSDVEKILVWSDQQLEDEILWKNSTDFKKAVAAIGIKMILVYGITYRELRKIKWSQYNEECNTITINNFELRLPIKLSIQIRKMKHYVDSLPNEKRTDFLFTDINGQPWGEITSSSGIPDYLATVIDCTSITSIVKYGISQLLKAGISDSIVKQITGASDKLICGCLYNEDEELKRIINNKIVTVDLYYEF